MNETERQELRDRLAREVMGWERVYAGGIPMWKLHSGRWDVMNFRPDDPSAPASQLLGVIEGMKRLGWEIRIMTCEGETQVKVWFSRGRECSEVCWADTLPDAVCLAARAALEGK